LSTGLVYRLVDGVEVRLVYRPGRWSELKLTDSTTKSSTNAEYTSLVHTGWCRVVFDKLFETRVGKFTNAVYLH